MKKKIHPHFSFVAALAISTSIGHAGVISYNWDLFGTVPSNDTSFAGVVSAPFWNNSWPGRNSPPTAASPTTNLVDDSGTATTLDIHFNSTGQWQLPPGNVSPTQDLNGTFNKRLLKGYVDMSGGQPVTVTLNEIPYANYDVYVYISSDTANREGYTSDGTSTFYFRTVGGPAITGDNAVLTQATETTDLTPNAPATYARFTNLSGSSKTITVFAQGNAGIAGVQVVEVTPPSLADGIWTAGSGNWSDTANWQNGMVAQGSDRTASFDGSLPAVATVDQVFTIGSLIFSSADHTIASGTGSLLMQGTLGTPTAFVEADRTATIAASLTGNQGLIKSGEGSLVLSAGSGISGTTTVQQGTLVYQGNYAATSHTIQTGTVLELHAAAGTQNRTATTFSGTGTLRKTGPGRLIWPAGVANFSLSNGALIDVREGTLVAGSFGNEIWTNNTSDLNVEAGATISSVEANVRVNQITGSGTIETGFTGVGYQNLTIGVADGSSTFSGAITNTEQNALFVGNLVKQGTGTIVLAGVNSYTGNTTIQAGSLAAC